MTSTAPTAAAPQSTGGASFLSDIFRSEELNATIDMSRFKGVAGLYYFHEEGFASALLPYSTPNYQYRHTTDYAAFAQGTYRIIGGLGLTVGVRVTQEEAHFTQFYYIPSAAFPDPYPQPAHKTFNSFTPKVGLDYQATSNLLAYISYTKGYIAGGFNPISPSTNTGVVGVPGAPTPYGAETVDSYEGGVKYTTDNHKFRVNAAIFDAEYKGLQLPVFFPGTSNSYTSNASNARIRGIELEPTWQALDMLQLYSNMSFETSKYLSPFNCALANTMIANCEGNKIKGVIPAKIVLGFVFTPEINMPGKFRVLGDYDYSDSYYNNVANQIAITQTPVIQLFNASIDWTSPDHHYTIALEGKNLLDNHYSLDGLQLSSAVRPTVTAYPGDPRMFDIRVGVKF
jgi:iron complex outermembrane receptor protein